MSTMSYMNLEDRIRQIEDRLRKVEDQLGALSRFLHELERFLSFEPCPYRTFTIVIDKEKNSIVIKIGPFCTLSRCECCCKSAKNCKLLSHVRR